jgi:hypothetical protein
MAESGNRRVLESPTLSAITKQAPEREGLIRSLPLTHPCGAPPASSPRQLYCFAIHLADPSRTEGF